MYGLEAIAAHNGWAISIIGICIVFTGLTLLSLTIAQLHKVLKLWDERERYLRAFRKKKQKPEAEQGSEIDVCTLTLSADIQETARQARILIGWIGEPFALPTLIAHAERCGMSKPYSAINRLLRAEIIIPDGEGYYIWNKAVAG